MTKRCFRGNIDTVNFLRESTLLKIDGYNSDWEEKNVPSLVSFLKFKLEYNNSGYHYGYPTLPNFGMRIGNVIFISKESTEFAGNRLFEFVSEAYQDFCNKKITKFYYDVFMFKTERKTLITNKSLRAQRDQILKDLFFFKKTDLVKEEIKRLRKFNFDEGPDYTDLIFH